MPLIESSYKAKHIWRNPHFSTIYPSTLRKVEGVHYTRERIELPDGDFLDLDWSKSSVPSKSLVIVTHGFLGNSTRPYILGAVKLFNQNHWDAVCWNHRGLSGENNRLERLTTHGDSQDLAYVINHCLAMKHYTQITLVGYSKGGNISLKYAGEQGVNIAQEIKSVVAISVPTDIQGSVDAMGAEGFYANRFKSKLHRFLQKRTKLIDPKWFSLFEKYKTLDEFTGEYIAPLHGLKNAADYYDSCSAIHVVDQIRIPSLILNAANDPVLSESCAILDKAKKSNYLFSEYPAHGGHCGFYAPNQNGIYWGDYRTWEFVKGNYNRQLI